ncbi:hypothetical protein D3C84_491170 [compost metagenome]
MGACMNNFLDSHEGPDWLHDSIIKLICGENITAPSLNGQPTILIEPLALWIALAEHLGAQEHIAPLLTDNREFPIERLLCEIIADGRHRHGGTYDRAIEAIGQPSSRRHPTVLHDIAESLIRPKANQYGLARAEELAADAAADRLEQSRESAA